MGGVCPVCRTELNGGVEIKRPDGVPMRQCAQCGVWIRVGKTSALEHRSSTDLAEYRSYWEFRLIQALRRRTAIRSVFDIGCGEGELLRRLREAGVEAQGIERNPELAAKAGAIPEDFLHWTPDATCRYTLVTAFDVIEHVEDPLKFVAKAHELAPLLLLTTPDASFTQSFLHSPEHTLLFTPASLRRALLSAYRWATLWRYVTDSRRDSVTAKYGDSAFLLALAGDGQPIMFDPPGAIGAFRKVTVYPCFQRSSSENVPREVATHDP